MWLKMHRIHALVALLMIYIPASILIVTQSIARNDLLEKLDAGYMGDSLVKYSIPLVGFDSLCNEFIKENAEVIVYQKLPSYEDVKVMFFSKKTQPDVPLSSGRLLNYKDFQSSHRYAVVGATIAEDLSDGNMKTAKQIELDGEVYEIIGVIAQQPSAEINSIIWINRIPEAELSAMGSVFCIDCFGTNMTSYVDSICSRIAGQFNSQASTILIETSVLMTVFPLLSANRWVLYVLFCSLISLLNVLLLWSRHQFQVTQILFLLGASKRIACHRRLFSFLKTITPGIFISIVLNALCFPKYCKLLLCLIVSLFTFSVVIILIKLWEHTKRYSEITL